jgi:hypothetical protein
MKGVSSILRILLIGTNLLNLPKIKSSPDAASYALVKKKLCDSIKNRQTVRLRYSDESAFRTFNPYVIYRSPKNKILVWGVQIRNDARPNQKNLAARPRGSENIGTDRDRRFF